MAADLMRAAEAAYRESRLVEAADFCRQALAADPRALAAHVLLGILAAQAGDHAATLEHARSALALDPECFEALLWQGIALKALGQRPEATSSLRLALRVWPGNPFALSELGDLFLSERKAAKAVACYAEAAAARPQNGALRHNLAAALHQAGDLTAAERTYRTAAEIDPVSPATLINLAQLCLEMGRPTEAAALFRRAHAAEPHQARGLVQLARAQREEGDLDAAEASLAEALRMEPDSVEALEAVSNLLQQLGRFEDAAGALDRAIGLAPDRSRLHFNRAYCRRTTEEDLPALARMAAALKTVGLSAQDRRDLNYALGKAHNDLDEPEIAMRHFDGANQAMRELMRFRPFDRNAYAKEIDRKIATRFETQGNPSELPILIVGMIRSGTTLVEQILSSHPQIGAGGELPYWIRNAASPDAQTYLDLLASLAPGMARVTDKMPLNYLHLGLIHAALPNARIVHCRRHPIDTCLSIYMTPYHSPLDFAHDRENIVFVYRQYQRLMAHWRTVLPPDRFLEVDYETLAHDPEPTVRHLLDFLALPWNEACLHPELNRRAVKTPSMWQVRQPVYKTSTDRWRKYEPWLE